MILRCLKHHTYVGSKAPEDLTCRTCCSIYIDAVHARKAESRAVGERAVNPEAAKARAERQANERRQNNSAVLISYKLT